ncbi:MAG TPA: hypothetical protein VIC08_10360, partial [Cellvibrionaceae bacterium]
MEASQQPPNAADIFAVHMQAELDGNLNATMATMAPHPHLTSVPVKTGGVDYDGVRSFYSEHLIGQFFPPDMENVLVSQTIGANQLVNEEFFRFTHTMEMDWFLPGVPPTGKVIEVAIVVIVGVKDGLVTHEHIYWDQAGVLAQIGLIDPTGLPICTDSAAKVLDPTLPNWEFPAP